MYRTGIQELEVLSTQGRDVCTFYERNNKLLERTLEAPNVLSLDAAPEYVREVVHQLHVMGSMRAETAVYKFSGACSSVGEPRLPRVDSVSGGSRNCLEFRDFAFMWLLYLDILDLE